MFFFSLLRIFRGLFFFAQIDMFGTQMEQKKEDCHKQSDDGTKNQNENILSAAMDAGFGSYTSFYRVFEKFMEVSPCVWRASYAAVHSQEVNRLEGINLEIGAYLRKRGLLP